MMNRYFGLHTLEGEWHALLPRYLLLADRVEGKRVLDIGCGSGLGASLLLELGAAMVNAIDHRPAVLELARMKHAKQGLDFHVMLWEELEFEEDTFDLILCMDPASPVTDPNLLREVGRVLKPDGEYVCAIERKNVAGLESVLPRYGYTHSAEHVELSEPVSRVPQVGELSRRFEQVTALHQRPQYSFIFEGLGETARREIAAEVALESGEVEPAPPVEEAAEVTPEPAVVERSFCSDDDALAAVELWFCGSQQMKLPQHREVRLPYYSIVQRLSQSIHDLQQAASPGEHGLFDEILERGEDSKDTGEFEQTPTGVFQPLSELEEETTTHVRERAVGQPAAAPPARAELERGQLDAQLSELDALHRRMKADSERLLFEARALLQERDETLRQAASYLGRTAQAIVAPRQPVLGEQGAYEARILELEQALSEALRERDEARRAARDEQAPVTQADDAGEDEAGDDEAGAEG